MQSVQPVQIYSFVDLALEIKYNLNSTAIEDRNSNSTFYFNVQFSLDMLFWITYFCKILTIRSTNTNTTNRINNTNYLVLKSVYIFQFTRLYFFLGWSEIRDALTCQIDCLITKCATSNYYKYWKNKRVHRLSYSIYNRLSKYA